MTAPRSERRTPSPGTAGLRALRRLLGGTPAGTDRSWLRAGGDAAPAMHLGPQGWIALA